jgi:hypothetical protein
VALLEDPDEGPEGGGEGEDVEDERLGRHQQASHHEEEQGEGGEDDDGDGHRQAPQE